MSSIPLRRRFGLSVALLVAAASISLAEPADAAVRSHTCETAGDLQTVIDAASPGDVIEIAAGICTGKAYPAEDFSIDKDIVLRGAGAGLTVLQGSGAPNSRVVGIHADVTIEGITIRGGTIDKDNAGGGLVNDETATLIGVAVVGNEAGGGGGIMNSPGASLTLIDSTVSGNTVTHPDSAGGGGITTGLGTTLKLVNSTISGNRAEAPSASASGFAGGILIDDLADVTLINTTVTANVAEQGYGGGIYAQPSADVVLSNSIVAGNEADLGAPDCFGAIGSQGDNLIGTADGCGYSPGPGDLIGVDPNLGPLGDNGGLTETHALLSGSHAIDHTSAPCLSALDQRGVFRPQGDGCDLGAVEKESSLNVSVGLVDPTTGQWHFRDAVGPTAVFYYGNPGDYPIMGDWNCTGVDTPGLYRQSDGYVYLRNSNTQGPADIKFFFGDPGDIPLAGDFNGNGCDTVSIYRPSEGRIYIINELGSNDGGLGAADYAYYFGNPGDKPFTGDFNGDGTTTVGLHRESTGFVYFRNTNTQGTADSQFYFGDPGDRLISGDWNNDGADSPALFRPTLTTFYFRLTNTQGNADAQFTWGDPSWLPVAGTFGLT